MRPIRLVGLIRRGWIAEVYKLIATKNGFYDLKVYGKPTIKCGAYLKKGDVYKFGETTQFNAAGKQKRYPSKLLLNNNLEYVTLKIHQTVQQKDHLFKKNETQRIDKHVKRRGSRPPGNICGH